MKLAEKTASPDNTVAAEHTGFWKIFDRFSWDEIADRLLAVADDDVCMALQKKGKGTPLDFLALVSPAAEKYLEQMAQLSHQLTLRRFGRVMQMYVPLYVSNECKNICTYCGFSLDNKMERVTLDEKQILEEARIIKSMGYDQVLLVSGEAHNTVGVEYFSRIINIIRPFFSGIMLEVQPLKQEEYERLLALGVTTVLVYQETYHRHNYKHYHPKGRKGNFYYRLLTPDRLGKAGVHRIGLGALLGLEDWRIDSFFTALHLDYLEKTYWKTKYSVSFPRLRPAMGCQQPKAAMSDRQLVQLICAYRIFNENVELSLSTRESEHFRNHAIKLGITAISAGSKTDPGGYAGELKALEQFEISDNRTPQQMAQLLQSQGYEPLWKDWDRVYNEF